MRAINNVEAIKPSSMLPVFEGMTDAVFIDDSNGACIWCNSACEEIYQISRTDIHMKTVDQLVDMGIFTQSVTKEVLDKKTEATLIHENIRGRRLLTTGYPIFNEDKEVVVVITISRDITRFTTKSLPSNIRANQLLDVSQIDLSQFKDNALVAVSQQMQNALSLIRKLANVDSPVLLRGESGVGKSNIAKLLHEQSTRRNGPFIHVNCSAIPDTLIEAELFGYVRGTFSGSRSEGNKGLFESANNGTIFLDEISEMPLNIQIKVLRVIQEGTITRVGSIKGIPVNVRIVTASNKDLHSLVKAEKFRDDLYYCLNVAPIIIPPLRDRPDDIPPLIHSYLNASNIELGEDKTLSQEAFNVLMKYKWPGNIRELHNIIERIVLTCDHDVIEASDLPSFLIEEAEHNTNTFADTSLQAAVEKTEKQVLIEALRTYKSTRAMARVLQVSQPTIVRKLNKYGITGYGD